MDEKLGSTSPSQPASPSQGGSAQESASYSRNRSPLSNLFGKFTGLFSNRTTAIAGVLVLVLGLGAATIAVQRSTEFRQHAATAPIIAGHIKNSVSGAGISSVEIQVYDDGLKQTSKVTTDASGYWEIANWARVGDCYAVRVSGNLASPQTAPAGYSPPAKTTTSGWTWQGYCGGANADTSVGSQSYEYQKAGTNDCATDPDGSGPITTARCDFAYAPAAAPTTYKCLIYGNIWVDNNGDGVWQTTTEPLYDQAVILDVKSDQVFVPSPIKSGTLGGYSIPLLEPITTNYMVSVAFNVPQGYTATTPIDHVYTCVYDLDPSKYTFVTSYGIKSQTVTPTLTPIPTSGSSTNTISGTVFIDDGRGGGTAGDGIQNGGEIGFASGSIQLVDLKYVSPKPGGGAAFQNIGTVSTNSSGYYSFSNLQPATNYPAGTYYQITVLTATRLPDYVDSKAGIVDTTVPPDRTIDFGIRLSSTISPTPTPTTPPIGGIPDCNSGSSCTACTAPTNTCGGSGTQVCTFTTFSGGGACNQVSTTQSCTGAPANCTGGRICQSNVCVAPTSAPTATPAPTGTSGGTRLALTVGLHGIGTVGDNASSDASAANKSPQRTTRTVTVEIYNSQNSLVTTKNGTVTYVSSSGLFTGTVDLGSIESGSYTAKVKSDGYLRRKVPGIVTLLSGQTYTASTINLVVGDLNNDNALNILDYNILKACINNNSSVCTANYRTLSDLNDNGVIDLIDYNLFLRELSVQNGE